MRILFTTKFTNAPSSLFNANLLKGINEIEGCKIDYFNRNYADYDVILFMGYDPDIQNAKSKNRNSIVGIIDPRPSQGKQPSGVDFIIANGIEMKDYYGAYSDNIFCYYIYPILACPDREYHRSNKIAIGYHGNKIHLTSMLDRVFPAIVKLSEEYVVDLYVMYNYRQLGKWSGPQSQSANIDIRHVQWSEDNYEQYLSKVDIGIVPNCMPISFGSIIRFAAGLGGGKANEHSSDFLLRFKVSSNPGRIFVFSQLGVPVVSDMFPSALQVIEDQVDGFICYSSHAWHSAMRALAESPELRLRTAENMRKKFESKYSPDSQNRRLIEFLANL